jgi:MinD-like ATPase involved in chromosome partitioning or flagellar assembly
MTPYLIKVSSQKGGVGKTTFSVNLATSLQEMGNTVLLVDFDIANPSVGFHLGIENQNLGVSDILLKNAKISDVEVPHIPTGLKVIPGSIVGHQKEPSILQIQKFINELKKSRYDYIIFDTAPGYLVPEFSSMCDEGIIITTPELSSCTSCVRLSNNYKKFGLKSNMVINRVKNKRYEIHVKEIEEMFGSKALGVLPESEVVPKSIAMHIPAILLEKRSLFSKAILETANFFPSKSTNTQNYYKRGIISFIIGLFKKER